MKFLLSMFLESLRIFVSAVLIMPMLMFISLTMLILRALMWIVYEFKLILWRK